MRTIDEQNPTNQLTLFHYLTFSKKFTTTLLQQPPQLLQLTHLSNNKNRWPQGVAPNPRPLGWSLYEGCLPTTSMGGSSLDQANLEVKHLDLDLEVEPGV